ncbi:MAG: hypothetical protein ACREGA_02230 [Candidatus Saccharimonadales bacterium]
MAQRYVDRKTRPAFRSFALPIIAVLVIAGGLAYYFIGYNSGAGQNSNDTTSHNAKPTNTINYGPSKASDNTANNQRKSNPSSAAPTLGNGPTKSAPQNPGNIGVTVSYAGVNGSNLQVTTHISGTTGGICTLTASQTGQQSVTATENVTNAHTNYYNCPPFSVPLSQFPNQGKWNVQVTLTSGDSTASGVWSGNPVNLSS